MPSDANRAALLFNIGVQGLLQEFSGQIMCFQGTSVVEVKQSYSTIRVLKL